MKFIHDNNTSFECLYKESKEDIDNKISIIQKGSNVNNYSFLRYIGYTYLDVEIMAISP